MQRSNKFNIRRSTLIKRRGQRTIAYLGADVSETITEYTAKKRRLRL